MELRDLREIHTERPHRFQRRVDDDFLFGSEPVAANLASKLMVSFRLKSRGRDYSVLTNRGRLRIRTIKYGNGR